MSYILLTVVTCPALTDPGNGGVTLSPNNNNYLTVATYTCTTGYVLTPSDGGMRTCEAEGQWTGDAPTCPRELAMLDCCLLMLMSPHSCRL